MLSLLSLKDFVIVENLAVEAGKGLTCLTGETGAGKSILIDALEFVLGARSDIGLIREGAQKTEVSAEFSLGKFAQTWLEQAQIDASDTVLLRRTVDVKGRSRCWINGTPVAVGQMHELGERLLGIHGQHAHQLLLKSSYQLRLLDGYANVSQPLTEVRRAWQAWQAALQQLAQATEDKEKLQNEADRLVWINEALDELDPKDGEWEQLCAEQTVLSNAADISENVRSALECLNDAETNASGLLARAETQLAHAAKFDPVYAEYAKAISQASSIVDEIARDAQHHLDHCSLNEERLAELNDRLNAYWRFSKKFHRTPEELATYRKETKNRLSEIEETTNIEALKSAEIAAKKEFFEKAALLKRLRQTAAQSLSTAVSEQMQKLAMQGGQFHIILQDCDPWSGGTERCEFLVSGHAGTTPRPLSKVASGGEMARISLAIAVITASLTPFETLIFDEVDSGIGGAVAEVVGKLLKHLGQSRQVLCVTHLPQVAACADTQWQVTKSTVNGVTRSSLRILNDQERIDEVARMLGGIQITESTKKAASEMLGSSSLFKED